MKKNIIWSLVVFVVIGGVKEAFGGIATELDTVVVTATRIAQHNYKIAGNVTGGDLSTLRTSFERKNFYHDRSAVNSTSLKKRRRDFI